MNRIRIYRTRDGWTAEQWTPAGGRVRNTYPTGQAVLIALDPRNRPQTPAPARRPKTFAEVYTETVETLLSGLRPALGTPPRQSDYAKRA